MDKKEISIINKELGGKLVRSGSLDFACDMKTKNIYKKNACLIRAIAVDHPFTDFSKSTATITALRSFNRNKIKCDEDKLTRGVLNIAKKKHHRLKKNRTRIKKMVSQKEIKIFEKFQFFDKYGMFPEDKIRIDVTISQEALIKLEGKNKSKIINDLILEI